MADGIAFTPGSGGTLATNDCGAAGHAGISKLAVSTGGSATLIPAGANGLKVDLGTALNPQIDGVSLEGTYPTYDASTDVFTLASTPTDFFEMSGSATKTVVLKSIEATGALTSATLLTFLALKRSTADTPAAATACTKVPRDSNSAASAADVVCQFHTSNPSALGTLTGKIKVSALVLPSFTPAFVPFPFAWNLTDPGVQSVVLRGTGERFCLGFAGATTSGLKLTVNATWYEI